mgnify:CR=1 FL=1
MILEAKVDVSVSFNYPSGLIRQGAAGIQQLPKALHKAFEN